MSTTEVNEWAGLALFWCSQMLNRLVHVIDPQLKTIYSDHIIILSNSTVISQSRARSIEVTDVEINFVLKLSLTTKHATANRLFQPIQ